MTCRMYRFLSRTLPLSGWRDFLYFRHQADCPACQTLENEPLPPTLFLSADQLPERFDLWPKTAGGRPMGWRLRRPEWGWRLRRPRWDWRLPAIPEKLRPAHFFLGGAFVFFLVWVAFSGRWRTREQALATNQYPARIVLQSARVDDAPARVFSFQARNPDRVIFYVKKEKTRS